MPFMRVCMRLLSLMAVFLILFCWKCSLTVVPAPCSTAAATDDLILRGFTGDFVPFLKKRYRKNFQYIII